MRSGVVRVRHHNVDDVQVHVLQEGGKSRIVPVDMGMGVDGVQRGKRFQLRGSRAGKRTGRDGGYAGGRSLGARAAAHAPDGIAAKMPQNKSKTFFIGDSIDWLPIRGYHAENIRETFR